MSTHPTMLHGQENTAMPLPIEVFLHKQANDTYCHSTTLQTDRLTFEFNIDSHKLLARQAAVESAVQIVSQRRYDCLF